MHLKICFITLSLLIGSPTKDDFPISIRRSNNGMEIKLFTEIVVFRLYTTYEVWFVMQSCLACINLLLELCIVHPTNLDSPQLIFVDISSVVAAL